MKIDIGTDLGRQRARYNALIIICNKILKDERVRTASPLTVDLLEVQLEAVKKAMREDRGTDA